MERVDVHPVTHNGAQAQEETQEAHSWIHVEEQFQQSLFGKKKK